MREPRPKIAISAGELSGDEHAALVVKALREICPEAEFLGMGGSKLRSAGVNTVVDSEISGNVMGFRQVLNALPRILKALRKMKSLLKTWQPDVLVLVDYPDFNFRLLATAKRLKIPVVYFIPPSVWAWRKGRLKTLKECTEKIALIYPFEERFYREGGSEQAHYVGHPFATSFPPPLSEQGKRDLRAKLGLPQEAKIVALFPGSRRSEIERHTKAIFEAFQIQRRKHGELLGVIAVAPSIGEEFIRRHLPSELENVVFSKADSVDILRAADAGILKSGTSNLQAAFVGLPFLMIFIDSRFAKFIVDTFVKIKEYSLVNIIRPQTVKEFAACEADPEGYANELELILFDNDRIKAIKSSFEEIRKSLCSYSALPRFVGTKSPYERVARMILDCTQQTKAA